MIKLQLSDSHTREMHNILTFKGKISHFSIIFRPSEYMETSNAPGYVAIGDIYSSELDGCATVNIDG